MLKIICVFLFFFTIVAHGEEKDPGYIIKQDIKISDKINDLAKDLDETLSGQKSPIDDHKRTHVIIRNQFNYGEGGYFAYAPHLDLLLNLPNVQKLWRLKFSTYDEDQESRGINNNRIKTTPIRDDYGGRLEFIQKLGNVDVQFEPRVEYINSSLQLSYLTRFRSKATTSLLNFHPEMQLFARSDSGVGEFLSIDTDFPIYKTLLFSLINEEQYVDRDNLFSTNNGAAVSFNYNDRLSQSHSLMYESSSRPSYHLDRYTVGVSLTHKLIKNILHYMAMPYLAFTRDLNYKGSPGINFELDIIF